MDKKKITKADLISYAFTDISSIPVPVEKNIYHSPEWRKLKDSYKEQHPLCELCLNKKKESPTSDVHHIIPLSKGGDLLSIDNLIALCHECHSEVHGESFGGVTFSLDMSAGTISISKSPNVFETKIVGTKEKNPDGSNRQEIISKCKKREEVKLVRVCSKYENIYLIKVLTTSGEQIGIIDDTVARNSNLAYGMEHGVEATAKISSILGEPFNLECIIEITRTDINWAEANQFLEKDKIANRIISEAKSLRKNPDKALSLYREAMQILMEIDRACKGHLSSWRYERYPIDKITVLLERQRKYKECLEEIERYQLIDDRIGLKRDKEEELGRRKIRVREKLQEPQIGSNNE